MKTLRLRSDNTGLVNNCQELEFKLTSFCQNTLFELPTLYPAISEEKKVSSSDSYY